MSTPLIFACGPRVGRPAAAGFGGNRHPPQILDLLHPLVSWAPPGAHFPRPRSVRWGPGPVGVVATPTMVSPSAPRPRHRSLQLVPAFGGGRLHPWLFGSPLGSSSPFRLPLAPSVGARFGRLRSLVDLLAMGLPPGVPAPAGLIG